MNLFFLVGIKACQNDNLLVPLFVYEERTNFEKIFKIGLVIQQNLQHPLVDKTSNIICEKPGISSQRKKRKNAKSVTSTQVNHLTITESLRNDDKKTIMIIPMCFKQNGGNR